MSARKFMVVGGFLGSGKTTSMIAFADYMDEHHQKAAIISNDLGAKNLVDAIFTSMSGCCSTEIAGDCICFQTEALVDKIKRLTDVEHADIVMSDIPGCGIGALDHVYFKLNREYKDEFDLAPFMIIVDPERLRMIMPEQADINLPDEMSYLFRTQLLEADVIVLNKIDTVHEKTVNDCIAFLQKTYQGVPVFPISAKEKLNIGPVVDYVLAHEARLIEIDTGYGGEEFLAAEAKLCWYDRRFFVSRDAKFDGNAFMNDYIETIRELLRKNHKNVPHLKVYAAAEDNDFGKASLVGIDYEAVYDRKIEREYEKYTVIVNARAACDSDLLEKLMEEAMRSVTEKYDLKVKVFFTECFGMTDEGA